MLLQLQFLFPMHESHADKQPESVVILYLKVYSFLSKYFSIYTAMKVSLYVFILLMQTF